MTSDGYVDENGFNKGEEKVDPTSRDCSSFVLYMEEGVFQRYRSGSDAIFR